MHPLKIHSCKPLQASFSRQACKRVFFLHTKKIKNQKISNLKKNKTSFHSTVQTFIDTTSNVNRFGQNVFGLYTLLASDR